MKILKLDPLTINQIAAGEVVENPASVVKELVENALDAEASAITIRTRGGGRQLIRIEDDGCGMTREEVIASLERHATSKLKSIEDLHALDTMGFRGEALPTIASVAKCSFLTACEGAKGAYLQVQGGEVLSVDEVDRSRGTTVEVTDLFYNVPARKKFLRSPRGDTLEIAKVVTSLCLAHPAQGFRLIQDGQKKFSVPPKESLIDRIERVLGSEFVSGVIPFQVRGVGFSIDGYMGLPTFTRHNRSGQFLFVNRRPVFSPLVSYALREGYGTSLGSTRHPVFVLAMDVDQKRIDVNVHPQKKEVRLADGLKIKEAILEGVMDAIGGGVVPSAMELSLPPPLPGVSSPESIPVDWKIAETAPPPPVSYVRTPTFDFPEKQKERKVIGTLPGYLILEPLNGKLAVVNQEAAFLRIEQERTQNCQRIRQQRLLIPETFLCTPEEAIQIEEMDVEKMGFTLEQSGVNQYEVVAVPQFFQGEVKEFLLNPPRQRVSIGNTLRKVTLSIEEGESLLSLLDRCTHQQRCPKGRSIMLEIDPEEWKAKGVV